MRSERRFVWLMLAPALLYVAGFFAYPIVKNVVMGFQDYSITTFYTGEAPWVGLANYAQVFASRVFSVAVVNTAVFTVVSISLQFAIGLALAVFFHRKFPLSVALRSLLLLPWLLPLLASTAVWRWILDQDSGILNQALGFFHLTSSAIPWLSSPSFAMISLIAVKVWVAVPFNLAILYGGLQGIPGELYEAASIDGASPGQAFRFITLPLLRPVIGVVIVLGIIYTLESLDIILGLTGGGPANSTDTLSTLSYLESFERYSFGTGAAISNIIIVVSMIFTFIYLRIDRRPAQ
ncbi:MAG TPA: sugar ABC transporter permease [Pseudolysinimonas sp.]|nr:sugar ABC transporter permease [Pseudolysinimonas sp.]